MDRCRVVFEVDVPADVEWPEDVRAAALRLAKFDRLAAGDEVETARSGPVELVEAFFRLAMKGIGLHPRFTSSEYQVPKDAALIAEGGL